jgi:hypothetical protein
MDSIAKMVPAVCSARQKGPQANVRGRTSTTTRPIHSLLLRQISHISYRKK